MRAEIMEPKIKEAGNLSRYGMMPAKKAVVAALAVALLTGSACDRKPKDVKGTAASPPPSVVVAVVEQRTVPIVRDFVARTAAIPTVDVRARVPGVLEKVQYKGG
jgi:hypothetical protein